MKIKITDNKYLGGFNLPLHFQLGKKKYALNLNTYRNLHYQVNNKLKKLVAEYIKDNVFILPISEPVRIIYKIFPSSKRRLDLDNMVVIAKYVQDGLVSAGILIDDDYKHIVNISFEVGELDKNKKGYVDIHILKGNINENRI